MNRLPRLWSIPKSCAITRGSTNDHTGRRHVLLLHLAAVCPEAFKSFRCCAHLSTNIPLFCKHSYIVPNLKKEARTSSSLSHRLLMLCFMRHHPWIYQRPHEPMARLAAALGRSVPGGLQVIQVLCAPVHKTFHCSASTLLYCAQFEKRGQDFFPQPPPPHLMLHVFVL